MNNKLNLLFACICRFILVLVFSFLSFSPGDAKTVTLGWDSNDEPDIEGYVVYRNDDYPGPPYRYSDELPEDELADPLHPSVKFVGLNENTKYHVAVTAYDTEGNESYFSNNVCFQIIDSTVSVCSSSSTGSGRSSSSESGGGGSAGCFISTAGLKNTYPLFLSSFISQPFKTFYSFIFLLLIAATASIFLKIAFKVKGSFVD